MMLSDVESRPFFVLSHLLLSMGFYDVWFQQGVGDYTRFISLFQQRLSDNFI